MIKSVKFENFRNLYGIEYNFQDNFNILVGKNGDGKTNVLEGIRLAFSSFDGNYIRVEKSDFSNSNDSKPIKITVLLKENAIPSLNLPLPNGSVQCGFQVIITKAASGRYIKRLCNYDGTNIPIEIVDEDKKIPQVYLMPLMRIEDVYSPGLTTGLENFIKSEVEFEEFKQNQKNAIKQQISEKVNRFKTFSKRFNKLLDIDVTDPKMANEKLFIVDGDKEHNIKIGSGYKVIANVVLCSFGDNYNVILIDELENHLHPALLRNLISEMKTLENVFIIASTHSPVVLNEFSINKIIDVKSGNLSKLIPQYAAKLDMFLHPGRAELVLGDNIILVEGFTEELILRNHVSRDTLNWTIVNVAGIMFEPYIILAKKLNKKVVVVSDNDRSLRDGINPTQRFLNLKTLCETNDIDLLEIDNTLETDLFNSDLISSNDFSAFLKNHPKYSDIKIAKSKRKSEIVEKMIELNTNIAEWHIVKGINGVFADN